MKELNLEVGQRAWSIQLGDCIVYEKFDTLYTCTGERNRKFDYYKNGRAHGGDLYPSLFLSNPFENQSVNSNEMVENKAELILALFEIMKPSWESTKSFKQIAESKLRKLLESI